MTTKGACSGIEFHLSFLLLVFVPKDFSQRSHPVRRARAFACPNSCTRDSRSAAVKSGQRFARKNKFREGALPQKKIREPLLSAVGSADRHRSSRAQHFDNTSPKDRTKASSLCRSGKRREKSLLARNNRFAKRRCKRVPFAVAASESATASRSVAGIRSRRPMMLRRTPSRCSWSLGQKIFVHRPVIPATSPEGASNSRKRAQKA